MLKGNKQMNSFIDYTKENFEYVGNDNQLITMTNAVIDEGRGKGTKIIHISNSCGLELVVLPDRCMDFYQLRYKGTNINWLSSPGIANPAYYNPNESEWLRSFFGGFMTTCGLLNIGNPSTYEDGSRMGLHGRIANIPAEGFCAEKKTVGGTLCAVLRGKMTETDAFGVNFTVTREIVVPFNKSEFYFTDTVQNNGFYKRPFVQLYHFNMGYPLLSPDSRIILDSEGVEPRNDYAAKFLDSWDKVLPPEDEFEEICCYHKVAKDENGRAEYGMENPCAHIGLRINYDADKLPNFMQWRMFRKGSYVMGLEPTNGRLNGFQETKEKGDLHFLEAGESVQHSFKIKLYNV